MGAQTAAFNARNAGGSHCLMPAPSPPRALPAHGAPSGYQAARPPAERRPPARSAIMAA